MAKEKIKLIIQSPKGTRDILSQDYAYFKQTIEKAEEVASFYGFQPIQTPHFEKTDLFYSSLGEETDTVEKQMYSFKTRSGDNLSLRPEGTAPVMRAYIEHGMHTLPQPVMLFYKGSFFRHENPQKGRFREFQQFGLEIMGESGAIAEAMLIKIIALTFEELGIKSIVHINSIGDKECRTAYKKELINYYRKKINQACPDCKKRFKANPLRLLDCKDPRCAEIKKDAPQTINFLCSDCRSHFQEVLESLDSNNISYFLNNHLVRGFDYYSRTVFEFFVDNNSKETEECNEQQSTDAIAAGGRYDYLTKRFGKKEVPSVGGAIGIDRAVQYLIDNKIELKHKKGAQVFLVQLGPSAKYRSLNIIEMFRKARIPLNQSISKDSLRGQLKLAAKLDMKFSLILGQREVLENSIIIKDMESESQETIPIEKVVEITRKKLENKKQ